MVSNDFIDKRILLLESNSLHIRHGIRWNSFEDEISLKIYHKQKLLSVDITEAITLFLNIYFGLLVREEKKINPNTKERDITDQVKNNIRELCKSRNRFI